MNHQDQAGRRPALALRAAGALLAVAAAATPALSASAGDAGRSRTKAVPTLPAVPVEARGNWMREYVQLRVSERNLKSFDAAERASGKTGRLLQPRIVGGGLAGAGDNPFQVGLMNKDVSDDFQAQFCGGTLIKPNVVVTAAHCSDFVTAAQVQVLTGSRELDGTGTRRDVARILIHPRWNADTFDLDVAVWILSAPATGLPVASIATADPAVGSNLLITGWGTLTENGTYPTSLYKATVPMVSRTNCNDANSYDGDITPRMLCAGFDAGGVDTCQGDSGGPIAQGNLLVGIVSWGDGCARPNKPGVYTRVSSLMVRNFIEYAAGGL